MKKIIAFASAAALGLGVAACDSPAEEAAEEEAEAMEEMADDMEDAGAITDEQADAIEAAADDIEDAAEGDTDAMSEGMEEAVN
ncbi:hypothetical protein OZN62_08565 [Aurantiacibacter sp. MUD11]|uniref:hypothetical protein n=1 Tax=Aurantiacibacter sp. MUD11 TaxID=3003265 RepID=UPI0022AB12E1|nr:hypothetical protein [Aurantiacibacter sp. MUD11]WAT16993.1 hypothetical protein OZN62_08565 [Aurantiacibacter sp. MUD11]